MHDQNFKNLITDYPREAIEFFAPSEAGFIRDARVLPVRQEQMKDRMPDRFFELDVPVLVEWPDGRRQGVLFCIEENSHAVKGSLRRHAIYTLLLSDMHDMNRVVPVAIHPFDKAPPPNCLELSGDHGTYLKFTVLTITLPGLRAMERLKSNNVVELICLPLMKYEDDQKSEVVVRSLEGLISNEPDHDKRLKYTGFISHYAKVDEDELRKS